MSVHARWSAHAKVNLSLDVGAVRPDGYHPYVSYATSVGIADTLDFQFAFGAGGGGGRVAVELSDGTADTLVAAAVRAVLDAAGHADVDVGVSVRKRIPAGAGLGGGSADAAAALAATAAALGADGLDLAGIAAGLGTDVPFCLAGGCARLHGRGELVDALDPLPGFGILVVVPPLHVPTAAVFAEFDRRPPTHRDAAPPAWLMDRLPGCTFRNDLEAAACAVVPDLVWWRDAIASVAGRPPLMTGSGAGYLLFAPTPGELRPVAAQISELGATVWVTTPVPRGVLQIDLPDVGT